MVYLPLPKYVKKTQLQGAGPFKWRADDKRVDVPMVIATCTRCGQGICKQDDPCRKSATARCDHCADGNRGGCDLVSIVRLACALANVYRFLRSLAGVSIVSMLFGVPTTTPSLLPAGPQPAGRALRLRAPASSLRVPSIHSIRSSLTSAVSPPIRAHLWVCPPRCPLPRPRCSA
jgi:hypothetical protein